MTIKQIRFVNAYFRDPAQEVVDVVLLDGSGNPVPPPSFFPRGSVTAEKLADNVGTSRKIQDGSITGSDLADNTVTAGKIASGVLPTNATKEKAGLVKQAAHVNAPAGETPTRAEFIALCNALIAAGQMASA